jgi:hypothetical protein
MSPLSQSAQDGPGIDVSPPSLTGCGEAWRVTFPQLIVSLAASGNGLGEWRVAWLGCRCRVQLYNYLMLPLTPRRPPPPVNCSCLIVLLLPPSSVSM